MKTALLLCLVIMLVYPLWAQQGSTQVGEVVVKKHHGNTPSLCWCSSPTKLLNWIASNFVSLSNGRLFQKASGFYYNNLPEVEIDLKGGPFQKYYN